MNSEDSESRRKWEQTEACPQYVHSVSRGVASSECRLCVAQSFVSIGSSSASGWLSDVSGAGNADGSASGGNESCRGLLIDGTLSFVCVWELEGFTFEWTGTSSPSCAVIVISGAVGLVGCGSGG